MAVHHLQQASDDMASFQIRFILYGSLTQPARWSTVKIMARNPREALKAARSRYRRAAKFCVIK